MTEKKTTFKNTREVADWLIDQGWAVSRASVYNHARKGLLGKKKEGVYSLTQIRKYAAAYLMTGGGAQTQNQEELNTVKVKTEIALKIAQTKREQLRLAVEEGKYIPKEQLEVELVGRAAVLESNIKGGIIGGIEEAVELLEGNPKQTKIFLTELLDIVDRALNELAKPIVWEVEIELTDEPSAD